LTGFSRGIEKIKQMKKLTNKLLNSKWTAVNPKNKEKHFIVTSVDYDEGDVVLSCILEAVFTKREQAIDWKSLRDEQVWKQGWLSGTEN
jgi:tryptophan-rich hypothetical protein